jgi:formylglycine-generating enzyme required for sulfatase activity
VAAAKDPPGPAALASDVRGMVLIAVITVAVAGWLASPRTRGMAPTAPVLASDTTASSKFRADAWFLPDDDLLGFVEIAGGPFRMGSDADDDPSAYDNERWSASDAQGTVDLPTYYIGRYEVTVAQFSAFVAAAESRVDSRALSGQPDHPVGHVSWPDALAYCRWLEAALREWPDTPPRLSRLLGEGWHVSLPSEAQWEKAARGTDDRIFPWGNEPIPARANYQSSGTAAVGSFACPECSFGLSDMSGNVWELTRSPYRPYPFDPS